MTARDVAVRLHASTALRRVVPARAAFAAGRGLAELSRRLDTPPYEQALAYQRALLAHTPRAGEAEAIAVRTLAEVACTLELLWRPWLMARADADGLHHLRDAQARGRGVVLAFLHYGMPYAMFPVLARYGIDAHFVAGPQHYDDYAPGYEGRVVRRGRQYIDLMGEGRGFPRRQSFATALGLLAERRTVGIAFDMPGSTPTPFLGRTVHLASGTAGLATQAGAPVVPLVVRRRGTLPVVTIGRPIDPADHPDAASLQAAVARVVEGWTVAEPHIAWPLHDHPGGSPLVRGEPLADPAPAPR